MADGETRRESDIDHRSDGSRGESSSVADVPCAPVKKAEPVLAGQSFARPPDTALRESCSSGEATQELEPAPTSPSIKLEGSSRRILAADDREQPQRTNAGTSKSSHRAVKEEPFVSLNKVMEGARAASGQRGALAVRANVKIENHDIAPGVGGRAPTPACPLPHRNACEEKTRADRFPALYAVEGTWRNQEKPLNRPAAPAKDPRKPDQLKVDACTGDVVRTEEGIANVPVVNDFPKESRGVLQGKTQEKLMESEAEACRTFDDTTESCRLETKRFKRETCKIEDSISEVPTKHAVGSAELTNAVTSETIDRAHSEAKRSPREADLLVSPRDFARSSVDDSKSEYAANNPTGTTGDRQEVGIASANVHVSSPGEPHVSDMSHDYGPSHGKLRETPLVGAFAKAEQLISANCPGPDVISKTQQDVTGIKDDALGRKVPKSASKDGLNATKTDHAKGEGPFSLVKHAAEVQASADVVKVGNGASDVRMDVVSDFDTMKAPSSSATADVISKRATSESLVAKTELFYHPAAVALDDDLIPEGRVERQVSCPNNRLERANSSCPDQSSSARAVEKERLDPLSEIQAPSRNPAPSDDIGIASCNETQPRDNAGENEGSAIPAEEQGSPAEMALRRSPRNLSSCLGKRSSEECFDNQDDEETERRSQIPRMNPESRSHGAAHVPSTAVDPRDSDRRNSVSRTASVAFADDNEWIEGRQGPSEDRLRDADAEEDAYAQFEHVIPTQRSRDRLDFPGQKFYGVDPRDRHCSLRALETSGTTKTAERSRGHHVTTIEDGNPQGDVDGESVHTADHVRCQAGGVGSDQKDSDEIGVRQKLPSQRAGPSEQSMKVDERPQGNRERFFSHYDSRGRFKFGKDRTPVVFETRDGEDENWATWIEKNMPGTYVQGRRGSITDQEGLARGANSEDAMLHDRDSFNRLHSQRLPVPRRMTGAYYDEYGGDTAVGVRSRFDPQIRAVKPEEGYLVDSRAHGALEGSHSLLAGISVREDLSDTVVTSRYERGVDRLVSRSADGHHDYEHDLGNAAPSFSAQRATSIPRSRVEAEDREGCAEQSNGRHEYLPSNANGVEELSAEELERFPPQYRYSHQRIALLNEQVRKNTPDHENLRRDLLHEDSQIFVDGAFNCSFEAQLQKAVNHEVRAAKKRAGGRRRRRAKSIRKRNDFGNDGWMG